jgi:hypothetical protein
VTPSLEVLATAFAFAVGLVEIVVLYRRLRYWQRRACMWEDWLTTHLDIWRTLIRDARDVQQQYEATSDPAQLHVNFVSRCDSALRLHFGPAYATRVDERLSEDWIQPAGLDSDERIFASFDTERRIAALQELMAQTADDLASISPR